MFFNKKLIAALACGAMINVAGTAFAAGADSFTDVPKSHWSYEALDYLAKEGIIKGMGDSTFQGSRTMSRYEMAAIVYRAMQKMSLESNTGSIPVTDFGSRTVLERLEKEYSDEISDLKWQVEQNTRDIARLKEMADRSNDQNLRRQVDQNTRDVSDLKRVTADEQNLHQQVDQNTKDVSDIKFLLKLIIFNLN